MATELESGKLTRHWHKINLEGLLLVFFPNITVAFLQVIFISVSIHTLKCAVEIFVK